MKTFYATFGQRYRQEPHPLNIHPDGWVEIIASNYGDARKALIAACGTQWSNLYEVEDFAGDEHLYKRGCLHRIVATTPQTLSPPPAA